MMIFVFRSLKPKVYYWHSFVYIKCMKLGCWTEHIYQVNQPTKSTL